MAGQFWTQLNGCSIDELTRRARILCHLSEMAPSDLAGAELIPWTSFGGDDVWWLFAPDGRALMIAFDHECALNLYADWEVEAQRRMYDGVPDEFVAMLRGLPDEDPFLMLGDAEEAMPVASAVCWFDGEKWQPAEGFTALVAERGLDPLRDSGLDWLMSWYLLGREFTPEALLEEGAEAKYGCTAESLAELFDRVGHESEQG